MWFADKLPAGIDMVGYDTVGTIGTHRCVNARVGEKYHSSTAKVRYDRHIIAKVLYQSGSMLDNLPPPEKKIN